MEDFNVGGGHKQGLVKTTVRPSQAVLGGQLITPPLIEIRGGGFPPWIFTKSLLRRLLSFDRERPSMTTDRMVKLEKRCIQRGLPQFWTTVF